MSADSLRNLQNIFLRDPRSQLELNDHLGRVEQFKLHSGVPAAVQIMFETAQNLALYAWFVYRFIPVAELHALSALEMALRLRLEEAGIEVAEHRRSLEKYLGLAKHHKLLTPNQLKRASFIRRIHERNNEDSQLLTGARLLSDDQIAADIRKDFEEMPERVAYLRNHYAHGSTTIHNHANAVSRLDFCSDLINQLWERSDC